MPNPNFDLKTQPQPLNGPSESWGWAKISRFASKAQIGSPLHDTHAHAQKQVLLSACHPQQWQEVSVIVLRFHVTVLFELLHELQTHTQRANCNAGIFKTRVRPFIYVCHLIWERFQVIRDKLERSLEMTTGDFKEEMDFSELFLCNSPEEFPISYEKGV